MTITPEAGMRLVPTVPTPEMIDVIEDAARFDEGGYLGQEPAQDTYRKLLAAAPVAPAGGEGERDEFQVRYDHHQQWIKDADYPEGKVPLIVSSLMHLAQDTIAALAARAQPPVGEVDMIEATATGKDGSARRIYIDRVEGKVYEIAHPAEPAVRDGGGGSVAVQSSGRLRHVVVRPFNS